MFVEHLILPRARLGSFYCCYRSCCGEVPSLGRKLKDVNDLGRSECLTFIHHFLGVLSSRADLHHSEIIDTPDLCRAIFFASKVLETRGCREI